MTEKQQMIKVKLDAKHAGSWLKIKTRSDVTKVSAKYKHHAVSKETTMSVRIGVKYANTRKGQLAIASHDESKPSRPAWFSHVEGSKYLLKHNTKDAYYIQAYANPLVKAKTRYYVDEKPVDTEWLKQSGILQPSYWNGSHDSDVMTISLDNIVEVY